MIARFFRRLAALLILALFGWCVASIGGVNVGHSVNPELLTVRMR